MLSSRVWCRERPFSEDWRPEGWRPASFELALLALLALLLLLLLLSGVISLDFRPESGRFDVLSGVMYWDLLP